MAEEIKDGVTVTVPAVTLRKMIRAVLPHASDDDTIPAIRGVRFEISTDWTLTLTATDRYTMAFAREPAATGSGGHQAPVSALLPCEAAKTLRGMLTEKGADAPLNAAVTVSTAGITVMCGKLTGTWAAPDKSGAGPDLRAMAHRVLAGQPGALGDGLGIDPLMLRRFAARRRSLEALAVRMMRPVNSDGSPPEPGDSPVVVLARGDWFLGLLMPARITANQGPVPWDGWRAAMAPPAAPETEAAA